MSQIALKLATVAIAALMAAMTPAAARSQSGPAGPIHASNVLVTEASAQAKKRVVVKKRVVKRTTVIRRPAVRGRTVVRAPAVVGVPAVRTRGAYASAGRSCRTISVRKRVGSRVVVSKTRRCI
jgi:hypothetical protein